MQLKLIRNIVILLFIPLSTYAGTYTVCSSGCDETTIQAVFTNNDLAPGDIVEVRADTPGGSKSYNETVTPGSDDIGDSGSQLVLQARSGDTITIDGQDTRNYCIDLSNRSYITVDGIDVTGATNDCIHGSNADNNTIQNLTATGCFQDGIGLDTGSANNTVHNVVSHTNGDVSNEGNGIIFDGADSDNNTITNCTTYSNQGDGIVLHGPDTGTNLIDGGVIRNCLAYDNGEQGFELYATSNATIAKSESYSNAQVQSVVQGITNHGNGSSGYNINNTIRWNYVYGTPGNGTEAAIQHYYIQGGTFYGNVVYDGSNGGDCVRVSENNTTQFNVYANTFYDCDSNCVEVYLGAVSGDVYIKNNIFYTTGTYYMRVYGTNGTANTVSDYNRGYDASSGWVNWGGSGWTLTQYRDNTTNGDSSSEGDPLLTNPGTDFTLQSGSPCINAAESISGYNNRLNPNASWPDNLSTCESLDIGAFADTCGTNQGVSINQ